MKKEINILEIKRVMRGILKRKKNNCEVPLNNAKLRIGKLTVDTKQYVVTYDEEVVELTKKEFDLLKYLIDNKDIVVTRDNILQKIWAYDYLGDTNVVDVYIRYLRSKIDNKFNIKLIHTIRGVGYQIKGE